MSLYTQASTDKSITIGKLVPIDHVINIHTPITYKISLDRNVTG